MTIMVFFVSKVKDIIIVLKIVLLIPIVHIDMLSFMFYHNLYPSQFCTPFLFEI